MLVSQLSMCAYENCEKSSTCKRFLDTPNPEGQSYVNFKNICDEDNEYTYFIQTDESLIKKGEK